MSIELPKMSPEITNLSVELTNLNIKLRTKYYSNGQKKSEGCYHSYHPVFNHISWYENGNKKSEGFYKGLHERYGEWKFWHSNGQLACTGIYEDEAEDVAKTKAGLWVFWDEAGNKVHEREYNEIELSVMLMIMDEWKWNKLRADGCSKELLDKFGEYIF